MEVKSFDDFYRKPRYELYPDSSAGRSHKCKPCTNKDRREYRLSNLEKANTSDTNSRLKRTYGIDLIQYNAMFTAQNGCCKGCSRHQSELKNKLAVDHCHTTGLVRGLLCMTCNLILGYAFDNINVLENLKQYLTSSELAASNTNVTPIKVLEKVG